MSTENPSPLDRQSADRIRDSECHMAEPVRTYLAAYLHSSRTSLKTVCLTA